MSDDLLPGECCSLNPSFYPASGIIGSNIASTHVVNHVSDVLRY
jgi:hypothetical protein